MNNEKKKIVVGLSGGVDSATSAYLIKKKKEDYCVSAVFMQNWDDFLSGNKVVKRRCTQTQDWEDALNVSKFLSIDLEKISFVNEYWDEVFLDFLSKLKRGITPNPDILCNSVIKFSRFIDYARKDLKADYLVTGHYAKIVFDEKKQSHYLAKCEDENKDQTYFLCKIDFSILPYLIFPLSDLRKEEVRKIAKDVGLPNFQKKDSTGICFVGENNFNNFISNYLDEKIGDIIDIDSLEILGKHKGAIFFTIGQRKGLNLGGEKIANYVVGKDIDKNIIYVAKGYENSWLHSDYCFVEDFNWLLNEWEIKDIENKYITAKFRHRQKEIDVKIEFLDKDFKKLKIIYKNSIRAITPGQFAVLYDGNICLGGGIIVSTNKIDYQSRPFLNN